MSTLQKPNRQREDRNIDILDGMEKLGVGTSYICRSCSTVLSVSMDLLGMKTEAVAEIVSTLKN